MMSQSALKRGLIDPQIQQARRAKMQQMASKAYEAKISSKQMPYIHSMYRAYHHQFWKKHDENFIKDLKARSDSLNISMISKISSAASSSVGHDLSLFNLDDKQNQPDQSIISKEMKKRRVDFGDEQNLQSEMKLMNKKKEQEIKNAIESKRKEEQIERQLKLRKEEQFKKAQKEKQIKLAKQKQEKQQLKKKKRQLETEQIEAEQRKAALQAERIIQRNRQQLRQKKQAQTRQINEQIQVQKKKIRQIEELQRIKAQQINLSRKALSSNQKKQQQQQQQDYQQVQEQCGPSYYEMMSNHFSNSSKNKIEQVGDINKPTTHKSMITKYEKKQEVNFSSSLRQKDRKEIQVPSSSKEQSANANREYNQSKRNLVHSNSNKSQDNRKSNKNISLSEAYSQKNKKELQLQKSIKVDPISNVDEQPLTKQQKIEQIQKMVIQSQVQINNSQQEIDLGDPSTYLDEKKEDFNQLNQQKDTIEILAQLNSQSPRISESVDQKVINSQILESLQDRPKLQSNYSLQEFRIDGHTIDHLSRPSLKIIEQQKQKKNKIQQIIVEQDINPSILTAEIAHEQHFISQSYDHSKIIKADDTAQQVNVEQKIDTIIYHLLLNIDQQSSPCPQCTSHLVKQQVLIKKIEELSLNNSDLIRNQEEFTKKVRQNTIILETKILNLENQKHILAQKLEKETFYLVNPSIKGQKRQNSESCLPQKNNQSKKEYNSEQQSGKNSSDEQQNQHQTNSQKNQSQQSD